MTSYDQILLDGATFVDVTPTNIVAECVVTDTVECAADLAAIKEILVTLAEAANIGATPSTNLTGDMAVTAGAVIGAAAVANNMVLLVLSEGVHLHDAVTPNAVLQLLAEEGAAFTAILVVSGEQYVVWVANSDTFAHSRYAGFNFNSMCKLGDHYYGANDEGIHLLEGDTDSGANIQYFMTLPETDFGTSKQKRVPKVYMGASNGGDMHIKVITREGAARVYAFSKTSQAYGEAGAPLGRGVKSRYWTFDLYNVEGMSAEVSQVEFYPVILSRLLNS